MLGYVPLRLDFWLLGYVPLRLGFWCAWYGHCGQWYLRSSCHVRCALSASGYNTNTASCYASV